MICVALGLQPDPPATFDAGSRGDFLTVVASPCWTEMCCHGSFRHNRCQLCRCRYVAHNICAARLLLRTEPQVRLMVLSISNDYLSNFHVAPEQESALVTMEPPLTIGSVL